MEEVCNSLELEFKRIQNDLEFSLHQLQNEFRQRKDLPDVVTLIQRIQELEGRFQFVTDKVKDFVVRRQKVVSDAVRLLNQSSKNLSQAATGASLETVSMGEADEAFPRLFRCAADLQSGLLASSFASNLASKELWQAAPPAQHSETNGEIDENSSAAKLSCDNKPHVKNEITMDNVLSEDIFNAVPVSIRGRCKWEQAVGLLKALLVHHHKCRELPVLKKGSVGNKAKKDDAFLSLSHLETLGHKVTGKSGECLVNTLKHLGLIDVDKSPRGADSDGPQRTTSSGSCIHIAIKPSVSSRMVG